MLVFRIISQAGERFGHRRFPFSAHLPVASPQTADRLQRTSIPASIKHQKLRRPQFGYVRRSLNSSVSRGARDSRADIDGLTRTVLTFARPRDSTNTSATGLSSVEPVM